MKTTIISIAFLAQCNISNADQWKVFNTSNSDLKSNVITTLNLNENRIWVGTENGIVVTDNRGKTDQKIAESNFPKNNINAITFRENGEILVGTDNGIATYDNHSWQLHLLPSQYLNGNVIKTLANATDGNLWAGTWGSGLAKLTSMDTLMYSTQNSEISGNGISALTYDNQGKLWVGTFGGGLSIWDGISWAKINTGNSDIPSNQITGLYADGDAMWVGTNAGMMKIAEGKTKIFNKYNTGIIFDQVNCFAREGNFLWIGTDGGLLRYDGSGFINYRKSNSGLSHNSVVAIGIDPLGNKWIGTSGGGVVEFNSDGIVMGLDPLAEYQVASAFPNPFSEKITVVNPTNDPFFADIVDFTGKKISQFHIGPLQQFKMNTTELPSGAYFIILNAKKREKLIIIKNPN